MWKLTVASILIFCLVDYCCINSRRALLGLEFYAFRLEYDQEFDEFPFRIISRLLSFRCFLVKRFPDPT